MKKVKFSLLLVFLCSVVAQAQIDDIYYDAPVAKKNHVISSIVSDTTAVNAYELNYMRYCLGKYYKARTNAYIVAGASVAVSLAATQFDDDTHDNLLIVGAAASITSIVMFIVADRWIKRSSIKPSPHGVGVVVEF